MQPRNNKPAAAAAAATSAAAIDDSKHYAAELTKSIENHDAICLLSNINESLILCMEAIYQDDELDEQDLPLAGADAKTKALVKRLVKLVDPALAVQATPLYARTKQAAIQEAFNMLTANCKKIQDMARTGMAPAATVQELTPAIPYQYTDYSDDEKEPGEQCDRYQAGAVIYTWGYSMMQPHRFLAVLPASDQMLLDQKDAGVFPIHEAVRIGAHYLTQAKAFYRSRYKALDRQELKILNGELIKFKELAQKAAPVVVAAGVNADGKAQISRPLQRLKTEKTRAKPAAAAAAAETCAVMDSSDVGDSKYNAAELAQTLKDHDEICRLSNVNELLISCIEAIDEEQKPKAKNLPRADADAATKALVERLLEFVDPMLATLKARPNFVIEKQAAIQEAFALLMANCKKIQHMARTGMAPAATAQDNTPAIPYQYTDYSDEDKESDRFCERYQAGTIIYTWGYSMMQPHKFLAALPPSDQVLLAQKDPGVFPIHEAVRIGAHYLTQAKAFYRSRNSKIDKKELKILNDELEKFKEMAQKAASIVVADFKSANEKAPSPKRLKVEDTRAEPAAASASAAPAAASSSGVTMHQPKPQSPAAAAAPASAGADILHCMKSEGDKNKGNINAPPNTYYVPKSFGIFCRADSFSDLEVEPFGLPTCLPTRPVTPPLGLDSANADLNKIADLTEQEKKHIKDQAQILLKQDDKFASNEAKNHFISNAYYTANALVNVLSPDLEKVEKVDFTNAYTLFSKVKGLLTESDGKKWTVVTGEIAVLQWSQDVAPAGAGDQLPAFPSPDSEVSQKRKR